MGVKRKSENNGENEKIIYMCLYELKLSLYYLHLYCHYRHRLVVFFCFFILPFPIISIIANYVLADEGYNSGRTTSLCARGIFHFPLLLIRTPMKKGPKQREKNQWREKGNLGNKENMCVYISSNYSLFLAYSYSVLADVLSPVITFLPFLPLAPEGRWSH